MSGELGERFREHIAANIDDDLPRLAFADWLEEDGRSERGEFVRVQVERARLPAWDAAHVRLRVREKQLIDQYGEQWLAEVPAVDGARWEGFRRGIVAEVSFASFEAMRANAHRCRAVAPVEAVTVRWPRGSEGVEVPPLAELRELTLTGRPDGLDEVGWLADSPQLATLRVLTARSIWAEAFGRLVSSPHFRNLKALRLPANNLGNAGVAALVRAASLTTLEEVDVSGRWVSQRYNDEPSVRAPGMEALAVWPGLASVRSLSLDGNDFGRDGLRALLRSPHASGLKRLSVRGTRLDGTALAEFESAHKSLKLETLDLGENLLRDVGAEYAALAPCLLELKELRMDRCEITQTGARLFAKKARCLSGLRVLELGFNQFRPAGLAALLDRRPPELHTLGLRDNDLLDDGAALLAGSPASDTLRELDLTRNRMGPAAALSLAAADHLSNLLVLRLTGNPLTPPAVGAMAGSAFGKRLMVLDTDQPPPPGPRYSDEIPF